MNQRVLFLAPRDALLAVVALIGSFRWSKIQGRCQAAQRLERGAGSSLILGPIFDTRLVAIDMRGFFWEHDLTHSQI